MVDDRVLRLAEEVLESGRTPAEVCATCPELLPAVEQRLRAYRRLEGRLADLLPDAPTTARETPLPNVPGYELLTTLGAGGMGVVFLARHLTLDRQVAVKMLLAGPFARLVEHERLLREARAMATLRHPNIVCVYDVGEVDGRPFFTMEYMEGGSLAAQMAGQPRSPAEAAEVVLTLAGAIAVAHAHGIVHRDLKPANVLVAADGTLKIGDFGIARSSASETAITHTGARLGTPSYMAPEQALGHVQDVGPATDVYALGAILYELLTGRPPFRGPTAAETERQLLQEDPAAPRLLVPGLPRDLETICLMSLRKEPHRRYPTARNLADDLGRFLRAEPIHARPVGRIERFGKWVRRHPVHSSTAAAAIVALGAVLSTVLWTASQRSAIERAVADDLAEVVRLEYASDWRTARNTLERAKTRLGAAAGRQRLADTAAAIERELDLVDRLGAMRFERAAARDVDFDRPTSWRRYRAAFVDADLLRDGDEPEAFAARVAVSAARSALVGAMDDWSICATNEQDLAWLLRATQLTDPEPAWRDRARDVAVWRDRAALEQLARDAVVADQPVPLLLIVAGRLLEHGSGEALPLLRRVQAAHPSDFWTSFALGEALDGAGDPDAIGFYRVAVALRPEATVAHFNLGYAFSRHDRFDDAIASMQRAVSLDPGSALAHFNLAFWLLRKRNFEQSLEHARSAARLDPDKPMMRQVLAIALMRLDRFAEAADALRQGIELCGDDADLRAKLERLLAECEARGVPPATTNGR